MATIFTVGHGTRSTQELVAVLRDAEVTMLADVRRFPGSKRNPHLGRESLETSLPQHGIAYEWWGETLGGRRDRRHPSRHPAWRNASFQGYADHMDTKGFRDAVTELEGRALDEHIAVMCAETLWWKCHRRLIADALALRGHDVVHLLQVGKRDPHKIHPNVRRDEEGWPCYDVNVDLTLGFGDPG